MTLHPRFIPEVPEETARVAQAAFRKGNRYLQMRDELGTIYNDEQFADLFPNVGHPAEAPWRLALVTVLQFAENLTDRQAADAVRGRLDWKYVLSLELTDDGFNFSVLSEFRTRLLENGAETRLFQIMLEGFQERGLLKGRGKQRTDSTHILANVRELNRLEFVGETLRATLNALASVAPDWLKRFAPLDWFERYTRPFNDYRLPQKKAERLAFGEQIGRDGLDLLIHIYDPDAPTEVRQQPEVEFLRRAWVYQFYQDGDQIHWRGSGNLPSGEHILISPYDPDARYSEKRGSPWVGYKVHLTEICDADTPHLITHVETTPATQADITALERIHKALEMSGHLPIDHLVDSSYVSSDELVRSQKIYGVDLIGPTRPGLGWQTRDETAFDITHFSVDFYQRVVICPQGQRSIAWTNRTGRHSKPAIHVTFSRHTCLVCPVRQQCTTSTHNGRQIMFQPRAEFEALHAARQRDEEAGFKESYKQRAGIEGTISQATGSLALRRTRYIGMPKVHLQNLLTGAALNLLRVLDWIAGTQRSKTRISSFAQLAVVL
jgi:transposase